MVVRVGIDDLPKTFLGVSGESSLRRCFDLAIPAAEHNLWLSAVAHIDTHLARVIQITSIIRLLDTVAFKEFKDICVSMLLITLITLIGVQTPKDKIDSPPEQP